MILINPFNISLLLLISLASSAASVTVSKANVFARLRKTMDKTPVIGELLRCPYCLSHWITAAAIMIYGRGRIPMYGWPLYWLAAVTLASFWSGLIIRAFEDN